MPVRDATDHRSEPHALGDPGERGDADPGIGLHGRMIENEAAVESECLDLLAGIEQSPQPRVAEDELNTPPNPVVGLGDPWMTRHASPRSSRSDARASRIGDGLLLGSPVVQTLDGLGDARTHSLRPDDS